MVEPINLNRARKVRAKAEDKAEAVRNRARFGRTRAEREGAAEAEDLARRRLEGHRRSPDDGGR